MAQTEPNDAAFPSHIDEFYKKGLTKREYFVTKVLQGLFASELRHRIGHKDLIAMSVMAADRLIEELNKTK
jgi:hypothetical protein